MPVALDWAKLMAFLKGWVGNQEQAPKLQWTRAGGKGSAAGLAGTPA